jgi:hypothetical protein
MKNTLLILFTFYFTLTSVGVLYSTHHCGTKVSSTVWGVSISQERACACKHDGKKHKKSCCKSDSKWVKAATDQSKLQASLQLNKLSFSQSLVISSIFNYIISPNKEEICFKVSHSPPLPEDPLFLLHRSLII